MTTPLPDNPLALGIDGGASKFNWSLRTPEGMLHHGHGQGANAQVLGLEPFVERLLDQVGSILQNHGFALDHPLTLGLGLSGVDRPPEKARLTGAFAQACPALQGFWVGNDALAALRQGAGALEGIVLIAGSGSICVSVTPGGQVQRVGGWGLTLGDEGSAAWIGLKGLNAITRMADGLIPATPLRTTLLSELQLDTPQRLIPWCASLNPTDFKRHTAALAPAVIALARSGEALSRQIIHTALDYLATLVTAAQSRWSESLTPEGQNSSRRVILVCAGGLLEHDDGLFDDLKTLLEQRRGNYLDILRLDEPASLGALALGQEHPIDKVQGKSRPQSKSPPRAS